MNYVIVKKNYILRIMFVRIKEILMFLNSSIVCKIKIENKIIYY